MDLADEFAIKIYEPPLAAIRESGAIADLSSPVSVAMLVIDFETEVMMNGIVDFLGNSTGLFARETIEALRIIGCEAEGAVLAEIIDVAEAAGMTHATIQADRAGLAPFAISTFHNLHGDKWVPAADEMTRLYRKMDFDGIRQRAEQFIAEHDVVFRRAVGR